MELMIQSASAELFTTIYPKENAETVFLLHGGPGVPMDFSPLIDKFVVKYQVIVFEQRGTGRSSANGAAFSVDEYLGDIDAIAKHFGLTEFHLFGHSWGGLYAQIYTEKNPSRILSLFLSSPSSGTGEIWKETESEVMSFNKEHSGFWGWSMMGLKSLLGIFGSDMAYQSLFKQVFENYIKEFDPSFVASDAMVQNVRAKPINKTRSHLMKYPLLKNGMNYRFPTIIAYGQFDVYGASKKHVKKRFPNATFIEYENAGHIAWMQNKDEFIDSMISFYKMR